MWKIASCDLVTTLGLYWLFELIVTSQGIYFIVTVDDWKIFTVFPVFGRSLLLDKDNKEIFKKIKSQCDTVD